MGLVDLAGYKAALEDCPLPVWAPWESVCYRPQNKHYHDLKEYVDNQEMHGGN